MIDCNPGDWMVMHTWQGRECEELRLVHKITPTQIVLDWNENGSYLPRHRRDGGRRIGIHFQDRIDRVATATKIRAWKKLKKARSDKRDAAELAESQRQNLMAELSGLFPSQYSVRVSNYNKVIFQVDFRDLTEQQVRLLAETLKQGNGK